MRGGGGDAEDEGGQQELGEVGPRVLRELGELEGRAPAPPDRGQQDDQGGEPEAGDREPEDGHAAGDVVGERVLADGGEHADGHRDDDGEDQGQHPQLEA